VTRVVLLALLLTACAARTPVTRPVPSAPQLGWRGMAVALWNVQDPGLVDATDRAFAELAALGVDAVLLPVRWRQLDVHAAELAPHPEVTVDDAVLATIIARARARGLRVGLLPIVDLERIARGAWRGTLAPPDVDRWWQSYRRFILHLAELAAGHDVALLCVGSELASTEAWQARWWALIAEVRERFHGTLTYSANWDHYQHVSFWDRLDVIGVSSYTPLCQPEDDVCTDDDALTDAWTSALSALVAFARGKPILITEVGYPSVTGALAAPWDYTADGPVDLDAQRRGYQAFATALAATPSVTGVFFWIWDGPGGPDDRGYTVRGKPAAAVLDAIF
jgi:hypothetical protein